MPSTRLTRPHPTRLCSYLNSYMDRAQERITKQLKEDLAADQEAASAGKTA